MNDNTNQKNNSDPVKADPVKLSVMKERLTDCGDVIFTEVAIGKNLSLTMISFDGLCNTTIINDNILTPLALDPELRVCAEEKQALELISNGRVFHTQKKLHRNLTDTMKDLLYGCAVLVFEGEESAISFDVKGFQTRAISEPTAESSLGGGKDGFVETIRVNTSMLRVRIQTNDLKMVHFTMGRRSNTPICVTYISGIANGEIVAEVLKKLKSADIDGISALRQIESLLGHSGKTFFPQVLYTERADRAVGHLLEGRVGIIVDGIPLIFIVPIDINSLMHAQEDYAEHFILASVVRLTRYIVTVLSLLLPGAYIAVISFHQEIVPTKLAIAIIASKKGVPFTTSMEALIMLIALEILLEAAARLPKAIGQTVGTVGAIVIGQAAIAAGILSPGVVIIIATAGICGFVVPSQELSLALRFCRLVLAILSTAAGLFGLTFGTIIIFYHLCSLETFGTPYLAPAAGSEWRSLLQDTFVRSSWSKKIKRPSDLNVVDDTRAKENGSGDEDNDE